MLSNVLKCKIRFFRRFHICSLNKACLLFLIYLIVVIGFQLNFTRIRFIRLVESTGRLGTVDKHSNELPIHPCHSDMYSTVCFFSSFSQLKMSERSHTRLQIEQKQ